MLARVLERTGATVWAWGDMYKAVEQSGLLYRGDAQGPGGVPPPGDTTDNGDDGETRVRRKVRVPLGSGGN